MRENKIKLCLVTIGQSPRDDLWDEIEQTLNFPLEVHHFGLLDAPESLDRLLLNSRERDGYVTQLKSGDSVLISAQKAPLALQNLIKKMRESEKPDGIVMLCTAIHKSAENPPVPIIYPGDLIRKTVIEKLNDPLGVILPNRRQWSYLDPELNGRRAIFFEIAPPGNAEVFQEAADYLKDYGARSIVFHCMGYPLYALRCFFSHFDDNIAHPRRLVSRTLNLRFGAEK